MEKFTKKGLEKPIATRGIRTADDYFSPEFQSLPLKERVRLMIRLRQELEDHLDRDILDLMGIDPLSTTASQQTPDPEADS